MSHSFVAIDFETATGYRDSACAIGIVTVENGVIIDEYYTLIQPPENIYWPKFSLIHGITPEMTESAPEFYAIYPEIKKRMLGRTIVAHNESFDRSVLMKVMRMFQLDYDELLLTDKWECTLKIYRSLGYKPYNLNSCCQAEGIALQHHDALSDARGCALLYLRYLNSI